jgi:hypothetical protein
METGRSSKFFKKIKPKKKGPYFLVREGANKEFLTQVNENLSKLTNITQGVRENYINQYITIPISLKYFSPIYFASAIAFLHDNKDGADKENFNDEAVQLYVSPLIFGTEGSISKSAQMLRRKVEFLRYIRLLLQINSIY